MDWDISTWDWKLIGGYIFLAYLVFKHAYEFMFPERYEQKLYQESVNDVNFNIPGKSRNWWTGKWH